MDFKKALPFLLMLTSAILNAQKIGVQKLPLFCFISYPISFKQGFWTNVVFLIQASRKGGEAVKCNGLKSDY